MVEFEEAARIAWMPAERGEHRGHLWRWEPRGGHVSHPVTHASTGPG